MVILAAFAIFFLVTFTIWHLGVALYNFLFRGPDLRDNPIYLAGSATCIGLVTLMSFIPSPGKYIFILLTWWSAGCFFELTRFRAVVLFLILTALTYISRLAIDGVFSN